MKTHSIIRSFLAVAASTVLTGVAAFAGSTYDFSTAPSSMPSSSSWVFTNGGLSITASGFTTPGNAPLNLFAKSDGVGETGLGFVGTLENEISSTNYMQLDVSDLLSHGVTSLTVQIGSLQTGEESIFSLSAVSGQLGAPAIATLTGGAVDQSYVVALNSGFDFIDITGGGPNTNPISSGNVVLESASFTSPGVPSSGVPDSGSTALLVGLGLLGLCCLVRSRQLVGV